MGANLALARRHKVKKIGCRAVVQLAGWVSIWHMMDWFSTACCLYGARSKSEGRSYCARGGGRASGATTGKRLELKAHVDDIVSLSKPKHRQVQPLAANPYVDPGVVERA